MMLFDILEVSFYIAGRSWYNSSCIFKANGRHSGCWLSCVEDLRWWFIHIFLFSK